MALTSEEAWERISLARALLVARVPYMASFALRLVPVEGKVYAPGTKTPTLGVTKRGELCWSAEAIDHLCPKKEDVPKLAYILLHECVHLACSHPKRAESMVKALAMQGIAMDPKVWAVGVDMSVNSLIRACDGKKPLPHPDMTIFPKDMGFEDGLTAEEYYELILAKIQKNPNQQPQKGPGQGGAAGCGSASGVPNDGEPEDPSEDGEGESEGEDAGDGDLPTQGEIEAMGKQAMKAAAEQAEQNAQGRGQGALGIPLELQKLLAPPEVPWEQKLSAIVYAAVERIHGTDDADYTRVNKKQGGAGYGPGCPIMASYTTPVPKIGVVLDTSGSMLGGGNSPINVAVREIGGILKAVAARILYCPCDWESHGVFEVETLDEALIKTAGGGGTSMAPAIKAMQECQEFGKPDLLVVCTDMDIGDPGPEPDFPVIWCNTSGRKVDKMPFGEVINVKLASNDRS